MNRREFLRWAGTLAALAALPGCAIDPSPTAATDYYVPPHPSLPSGVYQSNVTTVAPPPRVVYVNRQPGGMVVPANRPAYVPVQPVSYTPVYSQAPAPVPASPYPAPISKPVVVSSPPPVMASRPPESPLPAMASRPPEPPLPAAAVGTGRGLQAIARASWNAAPANPAKLSRMNGISRITVHHEGNPKPNNDTTPAQVANTLRLIQKEHFTRMKAADIGYHYIIDRSGRVWQGREEAYQGAHVSGQNANNLGLLLLGNYDIQQPTPAQVASLERLLRHLMRAYQVPKSRVYCHGELANTRCPGANLRNSFVAMRTKL